MTLVLLVGPTGVGKSTIWEKSIELFGYKPFKTYTTRKPRVEDFEGICQYNFISEEEFIQKKNKGFFFESEVYTKGYYGTSRKDLEDAVNSSEVFVAVVDVRGALNIQSEYEALSVFILPPTIEEMTKRIVGRNSETEEEIKERLRIAIEEEIPKANLLDTNIINNKLNKALEDFKTKVDFKINSNIPH